MRLCMSLKQNGLTRDDFRLTPESALGASGSADAQTMRERQLETMALGGAIRHFHPFASRQPDASPKLLPWLTPRRNRSVGNSPFGCSNLCPSRGAKLSLFTPTRSLA